MRESILFLFAFDWGRKLGKPMIFQAMEIIGLSVSSSVKKKGRILFGVMRGKKGV